MNEEPVLCPGCGQEMKLSDIIADYCYVCACGWSSIMLVVAVVIAVIKVRRE